jgi:hypothetical protein
VALILGIVTAVNINSDFCCVTIKTSNNPNLASVLLWSYMVQPNNEVNRSLHNHYLALVRDAYTYRKEIQIATAADTSSIATSVNILV